MSTKALSSITSFADVNAVAMPDVDELVLTGEAIGRFSKMIGTLYEPQFDADGKPVLNHKKKHIYLEVKPTDIEELHFTRTGKARLGYCAGWNIDYIPKTQ